MNEFRIIGISIRTTNENGQAAQDIPALWARFMSEGIREQIPNQIDPAIYCVYTDYESDHTKPYTTILGCKVANLDTVPAGMTGKTIPEATYTKYVAKGNISEGSVFNEWLKIWNSDLPRTYTADFEVYGEKAFRPEGAEVELFIAVG